MQGKGGGGEKSTSITSHGKEKLPLRERIKNRVIPTLGSFQPDRESTRKRYQQKKGTYQHNVLCKGQIRGGGGGPRGVQPRKKEESP